MKSIEQMIFETRFKGEEFDPNDYNDWAKENGDEAYKLSLIVAENLNRQVEILRDAIIKEYNDDGSVYNLIERMKNIF